MALIIFLIIIASIADSVLDSLQFHYSISIFKKFKNQQFFNPELSWKNKWKLDEKGNIIGEKFLGSSTIFTSLTDAWHFFKFIMLTSLFATIVLYKPIIELNGDFVELVVNFILLRAIYGVVFEFVFSRILVKKKKFSLK